MLKISSFFSLKYFFSKKPFNIINLISFIACGGIAVGSAALIVVLSVFNGLAGLIETFYAGLDPKIQIVSENGATFRDTDSLHAMLLGQEGIVSISSTLEIKAGIQYKDQQVFVVLKGVDGHFSQTNSFASYHSPETLSLYSQDSIPKVLLGISIADKLGVLRLGAEEAIDILIPYEKRSLLGPVIPSLLLESVQYGGVFAIQKEYDERFVIAGLDFVQGLSSRTGQVSALALGLESNTDPQKLKNRLKQILPPGFKVQTLQDQHEDIYRVMRNEKFISYLILTLMLLIIAINILGSLSMLILEKSKDIAVLQSMGATAQLIQRIFFLEGLLIGGLGVSIGVFLGFVLGFLQQRLGLVKLAGGENLRISAYPLIMEASDFAWVFVTVILLSVLAAWYPARKASQLSIVENLGR